jgi:hypothetical protein
MIELLWGIYRTPKNCKATCWERSLLQMKSYAMEEESQRLLFLSDLTL